MNGLMAAVWNKFTSHLNTFFGDDKRNDVSEYGQSCSALRPSCSLSTLNNKSLHVVRSSASSENLHRIQRQHLLRQFGVTNYNDADITPQAITVVAEDSPSTSSQCSSSNAASGSLGAENSASSGGCGGGQKKKSSIVGSEFLDHFRLRTLRKTFSASRNVIRNLPTEKDYHRQQQQKASANTSLSLLQDVAVAPSRLWNAAVDGYHRSCNKSRCQSGVKDVSEDFFINENLSKSLSNNSKKLAKGNQSNHYQELNQLRAPSSMSVSLHSHINTICHHRHLPPPPPVVHCCDKDGSNDFVAQLPYPAVLNSWYLNQRTHQDQYLNSREITALCHRTMSNGEPSTRERHLLNNVFPPNIYENGANAPVAYSKRYSKVSTPTDKTSSSSSASPLRRFAAGIFGGSATNNDPPLMLATSIAKKQQPKRSRSVGAMRNADHTILKHVDYRLCGGDHAYHQQRMLSMMNSTTTIRHPHTSSNHHYSMRSVDNGDVFVYNNDSAIDANFLALVQRDQPVLNNDLMFHRLEKLGEGSYATVYKSENRIDGSIVALKEIKLQPQEGLPFTAIREVSLLRGLKHANIVCLYQIIHQPHSLILVFEFMKTDLSRYMEQRHPNGVNLLETKLFLFQLLRGLAYCHERKILHRDLKPQNLLVSEDGELKLADFGLARAKSVPCRTFSHDVVTLWYRPPDVLLGSTHYSTSLDMWGVGCIFGEMCCAGVALFRGFNDTGDQLERIFSIRGVPDTRKWPQVTELSNWDAYRFPPYCELDWTQVYPQLQRLATECGGTELLNAFLQLNPTDRISAKEAMMHCFFADYPPIVHELPPTESVVKLVRESLRTFDHLKKK